jgi:hypothetical protein
MNVPAETVRFRQTAEPPEVLGFNVVPAGISASTVEVGTPFVQLPGSAQAVLTAPVQVVWA